MTADEPRHSLPVLHSLVAGAALAPLVEQAWGLPVTGPVPLIQHGLNDHYALPTAAGALILRLYRAGWRTPAAITWELDFLAHLAAQGAPVAAPLRQPTGVWTVPLALPDGERHLAVFQRAPGRYLHMGARDTARVSPAACAAAVGRSLARLHQAATTFPAQPGRDALDADALLTRPLAAIARVYGHLPATLARLDTLADQLRQTLHLHQAALDWGPCHGDMSGANATLHAAEVVHFDFDCSGPGWRAYDLGVLWWSWCLNEEPIAAWDELLAAYQAVRPLGPADLAMIGSFAGMRVIWLLGLWCAERAIFGTHTLHDGALDRALNQIARVRDGP